MAQSTGEGAQSDPPLPKRRYRRRVKVLAWRVALGAAYGLGGLLVAYAGKGILGFI
ncbi:hypothetical protein GA0115261_114365 [Streptomyces sp. OspMP-M43]|nr:hypothetical protein GA0115261_114365 [Streptomyces sp. OspMP-M43]